MSKTRVKRGRPAGMRARQLEISKRVWCIQTFLRSETVIRTALDDNHKNRAAAQKILMDCMLPISAFEKSVDSIEKINIVINTVRLKKRLLKGEVIK